MSISHVDARKVLDACLAKAEEMNVKVAIAIVDDHASLAGLICMADSNFAFLPQAAQGKALASAVWRQASGVLNERAGTPMMAGVNEMYGNRLLYQQGAVPVSKNGVFLGAIGVGGASPQQDEEIAQVGAAVLSA